MTSLLKKTILIILFFLKASFLIAQTPYLLKDKDTENVKDFDILLDENYTFEQVLTDSSLNFIENPKRLSKEQIENHDYVWIRFLIQNNSPYSKKIYLRAMPILENEIYAYNKEIKKWDIMKGGYEVTDYQRKLGFKPVFLSAEKVDTIFIKVKISFLNKQQNISSPTINIQKEDYFEKGEELIFVIWIVTLVAMMSFFLHNLYVYFVFKDKTYLYYLLNSGRHGVYKRIIWVF